MDIGERLRLLREHKGISQSKLANQLGVPSQSVSNYERGFRQPPAEFIRKAADFYEVSVDYLLGRDHFLYKEHGPISLDEFLKEGTFTFDGETLTQAELEHVRDTLRFLVNYKKSLKTKKSGPNAATDHS